ncbi:TROVE domain-containing protein [Polyangium sp. y55x31]|uniref:TROVE domain-containing protein n=1 Tax=Polyangium sp. y55x31 TaxID=3042688 RepID=UPI0024826673|nr:TROVE domain-containing protein [Polyangium sp. y55x31]MDI1478182.1 TROVE domain-containing protein [Polyangium sp. y55x31]
MAFFSFIKKEKARAKAASQTPPASGHLNFMAGVSYDISSPILRLRLAASTCFFGEPMYYHRDEKDARPVKAAANACRLSNKEVDYLRATLDAVDPQAWRKMSPAELIESAIDEALAHDAEATLEEAARLRNDEHIRTTPQVILVRAANHNAVKGTGLVRKYAPRIVKRADEPAVGLAYQMFRYGKPIPNALKKAWRDAITRFDTYGLAKYRLEDHAAKTVDVVNLVHPKSEAVHKLVKGEAKNTGRTWEAIVSARGSNRTAWKKAMAVMGHMAMLRNLRNMLEAGIKADEIVPSLLAGAKDGKQLPFRYFSAYKAVEEKAPGPLLDAIEKCLVTSLGELPYFRGRVMVLADNSGSAQGTTTSAMGTMKVSTIGNLTGVLAGMRADEGHLGVFGDKLETFAIRKGASIFEQLKRAEGLAKDIGQSTENGIWLFLDRAIRMKEHWDSIFVMSDMQAGHGGLYGTNQAQYREYGWGSGGQYIDVAKLVSTYRKRVNPNVKVFLVQIAGYKDTLVPEFYDRTYILGGWGEGLLRFAAEMEKATSGQAA